MEHLAVVAIPSVPFGPEGIEPRVADARYYREAARNIRHQAGLGHAFSGSHVTEAVAQLCEETARALDREPLRVFSPEEEQ